MYLYSCNNVALSPSFGGRGEGGEGYPSPLLQLVPVLNLLHVVTKLNVQFTSYMKISNMLKIHSLTNPKSVANFSVFEVRAFIKYWLLWGDIRLRVLSLSFSSNQSVLLLSRRCEPMYNFWSLNKLKMKIGARCIVIFCL